MAYNGYNVSLNLIIFIIRDITRKTLTSFISLNYMIVFLNVRTINATESLNFEVSISDHFYPLLSIHTTSRAGGLQELVHQEVTAFHHVEKLDFHLPGCGNDTKSIQFLRGSRKPGTGTPRLKNVTRPCLCNVRTVKVHFEPRKVEPDAGAAMPVYH